jgi:hypothetical protein
MQRGSGQAILSILTQKFAGTTRQAVPLNSPVKGLSVAKIVAQNESTTRTSSLVSTMRSLFYAFYRLTPSISVILNHHNWQPLITVSCLFFYKKVKQSSI